MTRMKSFLTHTRRTLATLLAVAAMVQPLGATDPTVTSFTRNPELVVTACTGSVTLSTAVDYVMTAEENALTGTIDVTHTRAAVVFRNIKPATVVSTYLSHIRINGSVATNGTNCRVAIYRHGAIVLPYAVQCQPLAVYDQLDCGGAAKSDFTVNTPYRTLGAWDNAIQSFTLRRGYMVTMANHTDGTGYSHCFIANDADITVNLPATMRGSVSFLRVFPWSWPSKKGHAGDNTTAMGYLGTTWFYAWNAEGYTYQNYDYVPQRHHDTATTYTGTQKWGWPDWGTIDALDGYTHVLGQNEPDNTSGDEAYETVEEMIKLHKYFLYSGMRVGTFATCNPNAEWVKAYVDSCKARNMRVDFVATHYYKGGQSPSSFISDLKALHDASGLPVWVTEWNNGANWTSESSFTTDSLGKHTWGSDDTANQKMNGVWLRDCLKRADQCPWIERLAVYNKVGYKRYVYYEDSSWPTEGGWLYSSYRSGFAYSSENEYFMPWNHSKPTGLNGGRTLDGKVRLTWQNPNTDCTKRVEVQRRKTGTAWTTVATDGVSDDELRSIEFDDGSSSDSGCTYRICNVDADGTRRYSPTFAIPASLPNGYTALTALPERPTDYYYFFLSAEADESLCLAMEDGTTQTGYKVAHYAKAALDGSALNQAWQLEGNSAGGYSLRNMSEPDWVMTSPNSWNFRTDGTTHTGGEKSCYLPEAHAESDGTTYWTLKNVSHGTYCGLWNNDKQFFVGAELAGNRTLAETDRFTLLAISKTDFNQLYVNAGGSDLGYTLANRDFSWGTATMAAQGSGSIRYPVEWTFQRTFGGWNDVWTRSADINGQTATYLNVWAGVFTYAELSQTVTSLPNGVYHITADLATTDGTAPQTSWTALYGAPADWNHIARSPNLAGRGDNTFVPHDVYVQVDNHQLTVGVRSDGTWFKVANIVLSYVGTTDEATADVAARLSQGRTLQYVFVNRATFLPGDVNQDGAVNISDVTELVNTILGKTTPAAEALADLNQDGTVNISDVTELVNLILGK